MNGSSEGTFWTAVIGLIAVFGVKIADWLFPSGYHSRWWVRRFGEKNEEVKKGEHDEP